ncbi:MAG: DUF4349 domain-containing protein [Acutalibacteraceae bacterium]
MKNNGYTVESQAINTPAETEENSKVKSGKEAKPRRKKLIILTAVCIAVVAIAIISLLPGISGVKTYGSSSLFESKGDESVADDNGAYINESSASGATDTTSTVSGNRKIIKNAHIIMQTKDYEAFMIGVNQSVSSYGGYTEELNEYNSSDDEPVSAYIVYRIPADKLDGFLEQISKLGSVDSKEITQSDITDSYIDTQSRIKALETEEKALLALLEKSDVLADIISVQDRLTQVRSELESYKAQLKAYDSQIDYSTVSISVSEAERIVKSDGSFSSQVKEKFTKSLYNLGKFFTAFAINFIGSLPYIVIVAVVAAVIIIIVKKRRKNK